MQCVLAIYQYWEYVVYAAMFVSNIPILGVCCTCICIVYWQYTHTGSMYMLQCLLAIYSYWEYVVYAMFIGNIPILGVCCICNVYWQYTHTGSMLYMLQCLLAIYPYWEYVVYAMFIGNQCSHSFFYLRVFITPINEICVYEAKI